MPAFVAADERGIILGLVETKVVLAAIVTGEFNTHLLRMNA
jgi:hypothetical protein